MEIETNYMKRSAPTSPLPALHLRLRPTSIWGGELPTCLFVVPRYFPELVVLLEASPS